MASKRKSYAMTRSVIWTLLAVYVACQQERPEFEPEFVHPLENLTVTQGRDVSFTCIVDHLGQYKIAWIKSDSKAILAIHTHLVAHNYRLAVTHNGHNAWKLHISNVQRNDSGSYMCQINTDPMRSQFGILEIMVPPDILDEEPPESGGVALEGTSIRLRCRATGVPDPTILWRREDMKQMILRPEIGRERQVDRVVEQENLTLSNIQRVDMGVYLCIATNGIPPSVSKRYTVTVHFHPSAQATNQLVAAPIGSDVTLHCMVEASPKALNSWFKEKGSKLIDGPKYTMTETYLNDYSLYMNLTINSIEKEDLGGYMCSSSNALGTSTATVRLQEIYMPKTTTSPKSNNNFHGHHKATTSPKKSKIKPKTEEDATTSTTTLEPGTYQTINPGISQSPYEEAEEKPAGSSAGKIFSFPLIFLFNFFAIIWPVGRFE